MGCGHIDIAGKLARLSVVALGCLALANCSSTTSSSNGNGRYSARLGVTGSPRVVEPGQPVPKGGGVYSVGKPYTIAGRTYYPAENRSYKAEGLASWYGEDFHGRLTANREVYDMTGISAAHATLPLPSYVRVTNLNNGRSMIVRVNDRGPYHPNRIIDLSERGAELLGFKTAGTTRVRVEYVGKAPLEGSDDRQLMATLRDDGDPAPALSNIRVASRRPLLDGLFAPAPASVEAASRSRATAPPGRPYELGEDDRMAMAEPPRLRARTAEVRNAPPSEVSARREEPTDSALPSPASAFAATRYDGTQAVATGRGLY